MREIYQSHNLPADKFYLSDDILPGGFQRWETDRDYFPAQGDFYRALGETNTPSSAIIDIAHNQGHVTVLDAGCGTGHMLYGLKDLLVFHGKIDSTQMHAVGLNNCDYSSQSESWQVRAAYKNGEIPYVVGDIAALPFTADSFDVIYSYEVLIYPDKPESHVREMMRVLKPGGSLFFNVDWVQQYSMGMATLERELDEQGCTVKKQVLEATGFRLQDDGVKARVFYHISKPTIDD